MWYSKTLDMFLNQRSAKKSSKTYCFSQKEGRGTTPSGFIFDCQNHLSFLVDIPLQLPHPEGLQGGRKRNLFFFIEKKKEKYVL
jgi:hypothetical protein